MKIFKNIFYSPNLFKIIVSTFIFLLTNLLFFCIYKIFFSKPDLNTLSYDRNYKISYNSIIPDNLNFCGERLPNKNSFIKNKIEKEFHNASYWKENYNIFFIKAQKWFPYIEPILKKEGVPDDFKYLAIVESNLTNAISPAGASGFWQLMSITAKNYDLEVSSEVDERFDIEKSTTVACKCLKNSYLIFKSWTLVAAAYNIGNNGLQNVLNKSSSRNYYDLILNSETGRFVYRILAYKTLLSNSSHFGIKAKKMNYFPKISFRTLKVDTTISSLTDFAINNNTTIEDLKLFNPWLLKNTLTNSTRKLYQIKIPLFSDKNYDFYTKDLLIDAQPFFKKSINNAVIFDFDSIDPN